MSRDAVTRVHLATAPRSRIPAQAVRTFGADTEPVPADRDGYWFPMLVFAVLVLVAPLVYRQSGPSDVDFVWNPAVGSTPRISGFAFAPLQQFGTCDAALGDPMVVALYWFCVVMFGPLASLVWYHRRAVRGGLGEQTGWYLLYACTSLALYVVLFPVIEFAAKQLRAGAPARPDSGTMVVLDLVTVGGFLVGLTVAAVAAWPLRSRIRLSTRRWAISGLGMLVAIASAATIEFLTYLQPKAGYGGLLIIAVGLLALSLVERGAVCFVVAALFTAAALVVNVVGFTGALTWAGVAEDWTPWGVALANLVLPGVILLAGAVVGGLRDARRRPGVTMM
jgi:hypothetical protein